MAKKKALGRGIAALIPEREAKPVAKENQGGLRELPLDEIVPNPFQPRHDFSREGLEELASSIREKGIIDPLRVRRRKNVYQLVYGERRLRAARLAGLKKAPVIVSEFADQDMLEVALVENVQRRDLNPLEEAAAYQDIIKRGASQEAVAKKVGKDRASVANSLRLLRLPAEVKELLCAEKLGMGHARALLSLPNKPAMIRLARQTVRQGLSVRQVEKLAGIGGTGKKGRKKPTEKNAEVERIADRLRRVLGTKVIVNYKRGRGMISIHFFNDEDLERLVEIIGIK